MKKMEGVHFYIDLPNLNDVVADEEERTGGVTHALHALDVLFSSVESYGKRVSPAFVVEKITGSRLHLYVTGDVKSAFPVVERVSSFAYCACDCINHGIGKYRGLMDLGIRVGVAHGSFYDFEFIFDDEGEESELTTIGHAANIAAKLQTLLRDGEFGVTDDMYGTLPATQQSRFIYRESEGLSKYGYDGYYVARLSGLAPVSAITEQDMGAVKKRANELALKDVYFGGLRKQLSFDDLSRSQGKKLDGVPLYADIRDFTAQFDAEDANLEEMARVTQDVLKKLYNIVLGNNGVHVQFQGDREFALFHNVAAYIEKGVLHEERLCFKDSVLAAMRMIDAVKGMGLHIGVGQSFGPMYAAKIGARGERDNILLGETVMVADRMEDDFADRDQIAVTPEVYEGLKKEDAALAQVFRRVGDHYVTLKGYVEYLRAAELRRHQVATVQHGYNGAYRSL
jgi:class 3 adenylate cyclase